jgi:hypothetical protein
MINELACDPKHEKPEVIVAGRLYEFDRNVYWRR